MASVMDKRKERSPAQFRAQAKVMKALAHPTRMFIVDELSRGERCVCDLTEMIEAEMPTVSRHLGILKTAGLIQDDKRGSRIYYRLRVPCCLSFLKCVESVLAADEAEGARRAA
jgi:DNA-binding transcriptional ArsR family regulator